MAELQRYVPKIYQNYNLDRVPDVKAAIYRALP